MFLLFSAEKLLYAGPGLLLHFKFEMQRGNFIAWMIVRVRQLRDSIEQLIFRGRALINAWEKIDKVSSGCARRPEGNHYIPL
jgi:hypothetical protein